MTKRREEMDSAMGPDEEPGEAHPAPADEALGLGGPGTEGKAGPPEGGTEPQIPEDVVPPTREEEEPFEVLREAAEEINKEEKTEQEGQMKAISAAEQNVTPPPSYFPAIASERRAEAGETGQDLKGKRTTTEGAPEIRPEGIKPDEGKRRKAG